MPFDLSPWGFVRPAIHCNVVIFKFISEKSLASSLPERGFLFLFQGKRRREGKRVSEAPVGVKILACAAGAAACWGKASVEAAEAPGAFEAKAAGASLGRQEGLRTPSGVSSPRHAPGALDSWRVPARGAGVWPWLTLSSVGRGVSACPGEVQAAHGETKCPKSREWLDIFLAPRNDNERKFGKTGTPGSNFARVQTPRPWRSRLELPTENALQVWQAAGWRWRRNWHPPPGFCCPRGKEGADARGRGGRRGSGCKSFPTAPAL